MTDTEQNNFATAEKKAQFAKRKGKKVWYAACETGHPFWAGEDRESQGKAARDATEHDKERHGGVETAVRIGKHSRLEELFESALYNSRFFVLVAVIGSLVAAAVLFGKGCVEIVQGVRSFGRLVNQFSPTSVDDKDVILAFIPAIDDYLFATVLLIFSMGLYELFISEIDPSWKGPSTRPNWLTIRSLDDLKTHIGEVIVMILVINFFRVSFSVVLDRPIDLLLLGGGIVMIAGTIFITHQIIHKRRVSVRTVSGRHAGASDDVGGGVG